MKLKVMTSNIRFANPQDGIHAWEKRRPLLQDIYQSYAPDLLGTQEGRVGQIKELAQGLSKLELIDSHREWIPERMYPCLFFNPQTVDVLRSGDIWLSKTPHVPASLSFDSRFPRLCTWALIVLRTTGQQMMVVNTHLDHILPHTRMRQVRVLIEEIQKISRQPAIVMGDFNESPHTELKRELSDALLLKDPWVEKNYPEETSHHRFLGASFVGDRIDWILIPENFECEEVVMEKSSYDDVFPSDHYPLLATLIPK